MMRPSAKLPRGASLTRCSACTCNDATVTLETALGVRRFCADVARELVRMGRGRVIV